MIRLLAIVLLLLLTGSASARGPRGELSKLIPYPFHAVQNGGTNKAMYIDDGIAALTARVNLIRRAKSSIVAEYFIFNTDTAGRIISKELASAAQRGVKVRLLIDKSIAVFAFDEFYAKEMAARGVEVRYYNAASIWRVSSVQFRTHRKMIVVDDKELITGGRNIGDDYFDLSHEFNFDDADVHVTGPIAKVMRESFDKFFDDGMTERPKFPREPKLRGPLGEYRARTTKAKGFFDATKEEVSARERMLVAGENYLRLKRMHVCPTMTYSSDAPGASFFKRLRGDFVDSHRFLRKTLYDKISTVDKRIILSSPYVIDGEATEEMMAGLLANGAKIDVYTNSLASTDATYVAANMYLGLQRWRSKGINVYLHDGKFLPKSPLTPVEVRRAKSGTHSKVQVYVTKEGSEAMIGTYNVDHRSNYYNAEMAVFCKGNDAFTKEVTDSIAFNIRNGLTVSPDGKSVTDRNGKTSSVYGANGSEVMKMKIITLPSWLVKDLL